MPHRGFLMCWGAGQIINMTAEFQPAKLAQKPTQSIIRFVEITTEYATFYTVEVTSTL